MRKASDIGPRASRKLEPSNPIRRRDSDSQLFKIHSKLSNGTDFTSFSLSRYRS